MSLELLEKLAFESEKCAGVSILLYSFMEEEPQEILRMTSSWGPDGHGCAPSIASFAVDLLGSRSLPQITVRVQIII